MVRKRRGKAYLRGKGGRFRPSREIDIVTRKGQPEAIRPLRVSRLPRKSYPYKRCSSTTVDGFGYDLPQGILTVGFLNGSEYGYYVSFEIFEEMYYAHSKGTFVWRVLRGGRSKPPYPFDYWRL